REVPAQRKRGHRPQKMRRPESHRHVRGTHRPSLDQHAHHRSRIDSGGSLMSSANLIDGRAIAEQILTETSRRIAVLKQRGVLPGLAFVRVGEDPASQVYVGMKERMSARLGIASTTRVLPDGADEGDLLKLIARLNA